MQVFLRKIVRRDSAWSSENAILSKEVDLPFVPNKGMELNWDNESGDSYSDIVKIVTYHITAGQLDVWFEDAIEKNVAEAVEDYLTYGWENPKKAFDTCPV